jgi:phosphatidylserine decarboxylase
MNRFDFEPGTFIIALPHEGADRLAQLVVGKTNASFIVLDVEGNRDLYARALDKAVAQFGQMGVACVVLDAEDVLIELRPTTFKGEQVALKRRVRVFQHVEHKGQA